jgi:hypothetical protein
MVVVALAALGTGVLAGPAQATPQSSTAVGIIAGRGVSDGGTLPTSGTVAGSAADDFAKFVFTTLDTSSIDSATLATYDTVVLNQVFTADLSTAQKKVLTDYVVAGGKLIIHDADGTTGNDYSWLPVPARTGQSCLNCGNTNGDAQVTENNHLVSSDPNSPFYVNVAELPDNTDAIGDANALKTNDSRWIVDIRATNDNNVNGYVDAYASVGGLIIFNGLDTDQIGSTLPSGNDWLAKLWYQELAQPWDPDNLPHSTPAVGGAGGPVPGCGRESVKIGVVGVCAETISGTGSQLEATGNVTLDGGVSVGDGPIEIDETTKRISTNSPAPTSLMRPGGPASIGTFGFVIDGNAVTDSTSGLGGLARVTLSSAGFGPLGTLRIGGLPFTLPASDGATLYLDGQNGGGLIGAGQIQVPFLGGLAPAGSASLGFYATTPRLVSVLGAGLQLGKVEFGKGWSFDGLTLSYQQPSDTWTASGGLTVPFASLKASGSLIAGRLDSISLNVGNQTVPLADSGFFFTDFGGSADGLVAGPLRLAANTAGFWGVPKAPVEPFYLENVKFTVDFSGSASLDGSVKFVLKDKSPLTGNLHLKLGVNPFRATGSVVVDGKLPTIALHVAAGAGFNAHHFTLDGQGSLKVQLYSGSGEEVISDAGIGASGVLCAHFAIATACQSMGFALTWAKVHQLLGGDLGALGGILGGDPQHLVTVHASAVGTPSALQVPRGRSLLTLTFTSPSGPPQVELVDPQGKVYSSAHPPNNMLVGTQPEFGLTSVAILRPLAGTWHVRTTTKGPVQLQAQTIHPTHLIRTSPIAPISSSSHPLGARQVVTLAWNSTGLPAGIRVTIVDSAHAGQISSGRALATRTGPSGSLRVGVNRLSRGGNYFALVASINGVPFQRVAFRGAAWRR